METTRAIEMLKDVPRCPTSIEDLHVDIIVITVLYLSAQIRNKTGPP